MISRMRMLHVSDIHLPLTPGLVPLWALAHPKRLLGWLNYRLRRRGAFTDAPQRLMQLVDFARERRPDVILFSGDVSAIGTAAELALCRRMLQPLVEATPRFICLPGNHDVYVGRAPWRRHFADLCPHTGEEAAWPRAWTLAEEVTLLLLDSTRPRQLPLSNGRLPPAVIERLAQRLDACGGFRFVAMHHGLWRGNGRADTRLHGLTNANLLRDRLRDRPCSALLHGHMHHGYCLTREGFPTVFCAGSATQRDLAGGWEFEVQGRNRQARRVRFRDGAYRLEPESLPLGADFGRRM